jgi:NAD(P)-dependent dehydrogenase (short-subunit alcohol dehydrogenase family)
MNAWPPIATSAIGPVPAAVRCFLLTFSSVALDQAALETGAAARGRDRQAAARDRRPSESASLARRRVRGNASAGPNISQEIEFESGRRFLQDTALPSRKEDNAMTADSQPKPGATAARCLAPDLLSGKTVWITGGGSGLGRAMALRFAELGAQIAVSGRRKDPLAETVETIRGAGGRASYALADVRDPDAVAAALSTLSDQLAPIDALVNNAAGNFLCPSEQLTPKGFSAIVDIVLKGTFHCTRAAAEHWISETRPGVVLNIATTYAWTGSAFVLPSACAKAGVVALTRSLAVEWARHRIRLNAIAPGPIPTEGAFSRLLPSAEMAEARRRKIPAGRFGKPEELAELAAFLVSDASDWMRGEVVTLDGGEWLYGAGEFNELLELPAEVWEAMREKARR